jgi:hypothetical protein
MLSEELGRGDRERYVEPKVLATYSRAELAATIRPHGSVVTYTEPGCGGCIAGCGCSAP